MKNNRSLQALREICDSNSIEVRAELAKNGIPYEPEGNDKSCIAAHRADLRRMVNSIRDKANALTRVHGKWTDVQEAEADKLGKLLDALTAHIDICNIQLEMMDSPSCRASGQNGDSNSTMKAMRNSADFSSYYVKYNRGSDDGEIGIADFLRGVANMTTTPAVRNALSVGTDTAGGFSVPSRLMPGILSALIPVSSLMQAGAGIVPIEDGAKSFTTAAINAIPTAAWRAESGTLATSDPTFRAVSATPRSLAFQFKVSRELLADGQNIAEALYIAIAQAFAKELDRVGLLGSGTAPEPRGVLNTSGIQSVTNGANGAALAGYANLFSAVQAILQADAPMPTAAIMSPRSLVKLGGLADTTTQPLRVPSMLESMKLIATSQISNALTVGSSSDCSQIFVGDFTNLYFMMRENVSVQVLNELYAATGEIGFACHMRADVVLTYPAAFCAVTGVRP